MTIKNGTAGADTLIGTTGADQLFGEAGNDILKGLAGPDLLDGGTDTDTVNYSGSAARVVARLETGLGTFGDAAGDTYVSIENVVGSSFGDILIGNSLANQLKGGLGNDLFVGGGGADAMDGGDGIDLVDYQTSALGVNVNLSTGLATGGDAAGDTLKGIERLFGSASGDTLTGNTVANDFIGDEGNDKLSGLAGDDFLEGDSGADTMTGGDGADTFFFILQGDSPAGLLTRDMIQDFSHTQGDVLDLSFIDANTENGTFDRFEFLGDVRVDGPGRITYAFEGNNTVVQINTAGGDTPEMEIQLQGHVDLLASDFIL
jgi:serralysin